MRVDKLQQLYFTLFPRWCGPWALPSGALYLRTARGLMTVARDPDDSAHQSHCEDDSAGNNAVLPGPLIEIILILRRWVCYRRRRIEPWRVQRALVVALVAQWPPVRVYLAIRGGACPPCPVVAGGLFAVC